MISSDQKINKDFLIKKKKKILEFPTFSQFPLFR